MSRDPKTGQFKPGHQMSKGKGRPRTSTRRVDKRVVLKPEKFLTRLPDEEVAKFYNECWDDARGLGPGGEVDKDLRMFFLSRIAPALKPVTPPVRIDVADTSDPVAMATEVMRQVSAGAMSAEQAKDLNVALESLLATKALAELGPAVLEGEKVIEKLESRRGR